MIKSVLNGKEDVGRLEFPKLMVNDSGTVILVRGFHRHDNTYFGVLLRNGGRETVGVGEDDCDWPADEFKDLEGDIVLRNAL